MSEEPRGRRRRRRGRGGGEHPEREPQAVSAPPPPRSEPPNHRTSEPAESHDDEVVEPKFVPEPEHGPAPTIQLGPDLPATPDDPDPATHHVLEDEGDNAAALAEPIANVVGIRFAPAGKILLHDAGRERYRRGDRVIVDAERSQRLATVATDSLRRPIAADRKLPRVLRRAHDGDLRAEAAAEQQGAGLLRLAKEKVRDLDLPIKVFRVEAPAGGQKKLFVYFLSEERIDLRDFLREMGSATGARIELRQIGARDEAKMIGGIGSCGLELCCSTWLPEMVPVSIKMAKDQGLVLNPTKVSGQCGRLKCCLVYEQATYAEMRKGLPKLGKRVITPEGEGRVVEVDVLRQRIRVTTGPGEFHVLTADQVKPMFPSQKAEAEPEPEPEEPESEDE